jgi:glycosyltransferase involved in cell wall biosynthesis
LEDLMSSQGDVHGVHSMAPPPEPGDGPLPRVVIAHDFMEIYGGAERVTEQFALAFPDAEVHALIGRGSVAERMQIADRFHSILPRRSRLLRHYRLSAPALPLITAAHALPEADVLLSSSYAFAHHLRTVDRAPHVCYCHSPMRFAWTMQDAYRDHWAGAGPAALAFSAFAGAMRVADRRASRHVDRYLTQSPYVAEQIERFLHRPGVVVGAPIDGERFVPSGAPPQEHFLFVGRILEPYKRVGVTVEAFRRLGLPLVVAGDGPALAALRADAPPNVTFLGHLGDDALVEAMQTCRAAIFPSRDDFGLVPLEVNACGRPVLAYAGGGALHTVREGVSGAFFAEQTVDAVEQAVRAFDDADYDSDVVREHAMQWDARTFRARIVHHVREIAARS